MRAQHHSCHPANTRAAQTTVHVAQTKHFRGSACSSLAHCKLPGSSALLSLQTMGLCCSEGSPWASLLSHFGLMLASAANIGYELRSAHKITKPIRNMSCEASNQLLNTDYSKRRPCCQSKQVKQDQMKTWLYCSSARICLRHLSARTWNEIKSMCHAMLTVWVAGRKVGWGRSNLVVSWPHHARRYMQFQAVLPKPKTGSALGPIKCSRATQDPSSIVKEQKASKGFLFQV